jgi:hypothetical protein
MKATGLLYPEIRINFSSGNPDKEILVQNDRQQVSVR